MRFRVLLTTVLVMSLLALSGPAQSLHGWLAHSHGSGHAHGHSHSHTSGHTSGHASGGGVQVAALAGHHVDGGDEPGHSAALAAMDGRRPEHGDGRTHRDARGHVHIHSHTAGLIPASESAVALTALHTSVSEPQKPPGQSSEAADEPAQETSPELAHESEAPPSDERERECDMCDLLARHAMVEPVALSPAARFVLALQTRLLIADEHPPAILFTSHLGGRDPPTAC